MKQFSVTFMKTATAFLLPFFMLLSFLMPAASSAFAVEVTSMDESPIEKDLEDIDLTFYPYNKNGIHALVEGVGFMEYAYSLRPNPTRYFGLYFYVYNPTQRKIVTRIGANTVNMAIEYDTAGEPVKYSKLSITLLDATADYRFLKFKLTNPGEARQRAGEYAAAHDGVRRYDIASIELWFEGDKNATDAAPKTTKTEDPEIKIQEQGATYYCSGYAAGCASDPDAESTLSIVARDLLTVRLDIHHTYFRPEGTNGKNRFTHDSLNSFYFTLPKSLTDEYGTLTRIRGEYRKALSSPILVTGDQTYYDRFSSVLGQDLGYVKENDPFPYFFGASAGRKAGVQMMDWLYHPPENFGTETKIFTSLNYIFKAPGKAENYDLSSETIEKWIDTYTAEHPVTTDKLVDGKYHPALFDWVADEKTLFDVKATDVTPDLTNIKITQNLWNQWWGTSSSSESPYDGQEAIHQVTKEDFIFDDNGALNITKTAEENFIAPADAEEYLKFYNENSAENEIFLVRFALDDYMSSVACMGKFNCYTPDWLRWLNTLTSFAFNPLVWDGTLTDDNGTIIMTDRSSDAYVAQEYFYLDFDIIDLTLADEGKETVIGVVMDPVDIFPDVTAAKSIEIGNIGIVIALAVISALLAVALGFSIYGEVKQKKTDELKTVTVNVRKED